MNADDISKLIKRVFAGIVAVIVAIGQVISGRRNIEEPETPGTKAETREERRKQREARKVREGKGERKGKNKRERGQSREGRNKQQHREKVEA